MIIGWVRKSLDLPTNRGGRASKKGRNLALEYLIMLLLLGERSKKAERRLF
jgi:hypothetical protein